MDLLQNLVLGFSIAATWHNLLFCFVGVLLGTLIGVLPGVGPTATVALLLPVTVSLSPETAMIMLAGIYYGSQYGGSTTAILLNLPGEPSSAVTSLDGYAMARQGKAGAALMIAAFGSCFAGLVATAIIGLFAPALADVALIFGPHEYFALMVLGLIASIALANGSFLKALGMVILGLLLGLVGTDLYTAASRFTLGQLALADGLDFVAVSIGIFGITEIIRNLEQPAGSGTVSTVSRMRLSMVELRQSIIPVLRGTGIGSVLGILPGGGATLSSFVSYAVEKRVARDPSRFGKGAIEGVAGPEAANNAGAQTSFIPMLTLGLPSTPMMALMIGALILQGIAPGPNVITNNPGMFWAIIASMCIGNIMLVILNVPLVGVWVRLLSVPYTILFPAVVTFACIGVYSISLSTVDLYTATFLGLLGYLFYRFDCEPVPLLLGFIVGPAVEEHLRRAMLVGRGDPMVFLERPISASLLLVALIVIVLVLLPSISRKRKEVFVENA
jgi:putative tricarboxylic transport membrane protein